MKKWVVLLLFFGTFSLWSQDRNEILIQGIIVADDALLSGIEVVNLGNEKVALTNSKGEFSILAKADDILVFSSKSLEMRRVIIDEDDLKSGIITVNMYPKINELDEVIVKRTSEFNAVSIGIIQNKPKQYTPAERKLRTATGLDAIIGLNTSFSLDPLLNLASGRTVELLKNTEVERKQFWLDKISEMFSEKVLIDKFKIPSNYIKGFQYYILDNKTFVDTLKEKNTAMSSFIMIELAEKFNKMIACE